MDGPVWALGLMSGTSMDGIDAAIVETDGVRITAFGPAATTPYPEALRAAIRASLGRPDPDPALVRGLTDAHADAISALLTQFPEFKPRIRLVGLHGHTVLHAPREGRTLQIGDGARLAAATGFDVVFDFRSADVAAGGEGAPLAPLYHRALCHDIEGPVAVLNIGGISNVTWIGGPDDDPVAFDTGPGNALLDDWVASTTGLDCDRDGSVSAKGLANEAILAALLGHPYFAAPPPKSLDRLDFTNDAVRGLSPEDGAATLVRFTADSIAANVSHLPSPPARWLVTGGGRRNPTIMQGLRDALGVPVDAVEAVGWDGDALEAQAFAFLAVRSLRGLPLSVPTTTGVPVPTTGGRLSRAAA